jgi:ATP-dependent Lon protease
MKKAGTSNPVFCLDEVDKLSSDFQVIPHPALLEVLDRSRRAFNDHYLEVELRPVRRLFVTTANVLQTIPAPCRTAWR